MYFKDKKSACPSDLKIKGEKMRRLPVFLVIDVSESMVGEPLRIMQEGMNRLIQDLRKSPYALETVYLSIIGFAGKVQTLTPLMELISFYPPRLPIGSGTSIGQALNHLMNELDKNIIQNTPEKRGDWKPVIYFMSDGTSTDEVQWAINRWQNHYSNKATLISIGIGKHADLYHLQKISNQTLRLESSGEEDLKKFIEWVTQSINAKSRSLGTELPLTLTKKEEHFNLSLIKDLNEAKAKDESFVILSALCRKKKLPYVLKYEKIDELGSNIRYQFTGSYALEKDYYDWSETKNFQQEIHSSKLIGASACPHCHGDYGLVSCDCGQIFCVAFGEEHYGECPNCHSPVHLSEGGGDDFNISRSRG